LKLWEEELGLRGPRVLRQCRGALEVDCNTDYGSVHQLVSTGPKWA